MGLKTGKHKIMQMIGYIAEADEKRMSVKTSCSKQWAVGALYHFVINGYSYLQAGSYSEHCGAVGVRANPRTPSVTGVIYTQIPFLPISYPAPDLAIIDSCCWPIFTGITLTPYCLKLF